MKSETATQALTRIVIELEFCPKCNVMIEKTVNREPTNKTTADMMRKSISRQIERHNRSWLIPQHRVKH